MSTARAAPTPHIINLDEMLAFIEEEGAHWKLYASYGWKRIWFRHAGGYRVQARGLVLYEGTDGSTAVRHYNEAK
jgi:hypothetical protein